MATCITKARQFITRSNINAEIVVADNGSTDNSRQIAGKHGCRVIEVKEKGYGAALLGGIQAARGKYIIMGDADDSYDFSNLSAFMEKLRAGCDLVMGNRFKGGIKPGAMPFLHRYLGNPLLSAMGKKLFKSPVGDFHCGLRGFKKDALMKLDLQTTGMEFASEMVVKATLHHLRICEVPTILYKDGRARPPHLRMWRDGWRHLRFLLLYNPRWLFFYPGIFLILVGFMVGLWLLPGPRHVGNITFDIHTLLYAMLAILLGFQSISFAAFTKIFAMTEKLLPEDPKFNRIFRFFNLELGLFIGGVFTLVGFLTSLYALYLWERNAFGRLNPAHMLRLVIPGITFFVLGCQIILASFFLSILGLKRK